MKIFISTILVYISFSFSILGQKMGIIALSNEWGAIISFILYISYSIITPFLFIYNYYLKRYINNKIFYNINKNICIINIILNLSYCFITNCEIYMVGSFLYFIPFKFKNYIDFYNSINLALIFTYITIKKSNKFLYILFITLAVYFSFLTLLYFAIILFFIIFST